MTDTMRLSPWAHPKSQRWFVALFDRSSFALSIENELIQPDEYLNLGLVRMMMAFSVLLGRPGIWPDRHQGILKLVLKKSRAFANVPAPPTTEKSLTIKQHLSQEAMASELSHEIELLRRRVGSSFRKSRIGAPPSWEPFWEGSDTADHSDASSPWDDPDGSRWVRGFGAWHQMMRLIHGSLQLEARSDPHGIRAAAAMVILFCRTNLWPVDEHHAIDPILEIAARQLANVKQLYEMKSRTNPKLQTNSSFRDLLKSLDQEIRILEARLTDPKPEIPNHPPCTWGDFWTESQG